MLNVQPTQDSLAAFGQVVLHKRAAWNAVFGVALVVEGFEKEAAVVTEDFRFDQ